MVHTHMVVGSPDGTTRAGHVLEAYVSPTLEVLEVMVTVDPIATPWSSRKPCAGLSIYAANTSRGWCHNLWAMPPAAIFSVPGRRCWPRAVRRSKRARHQSEPYFR